MDNDVVWIYRLCGGQETFLGPCLKSQHKEVLLALKNNGGPRYEYRADNWSRLITPDEVWADPDIK